MTFLGLKYDAMSVEPRNAHTLTYTPLQVIAIFAIMRAVTKRLLVSR